MPPLSSGFVSTTLTLSYERLAHSDTFPARWGFGPDFPLQYVVSAGLDCVITFGKKVLSLAFCVCEPNLQPMHLSQFPLILKKAQKISGKLEPLRFLFLLLKSVRLLFFILLYSSLLSVVSLSLPAYGVEDHCHMLCNRLLLKYPSCFWVVLFTPLGVWGCLIFLPDFHYVRMSLLR